MRKFYSFLVLSGLLVFGSLNLNSVEGGTMSGKSDSAGIPGSIVGTPARPLLDVKMAAYYSLANVLGKTGARGAEVADPWNPESDEFIIQDKKITPDYTVDPKGMESAKSSKTIQGAVNKACLDAKAKGRTARIYIAVKPGIYKEVVYIPAVSDTASTTPKAETAFIVPPITIYGLDADPKKTKISFNLDANLWGSDPSKPVDYERRVNPSGKIYINDNTKTFSGIYKIYNGILGRAKTGIGTGNTALVYVRNVGFQMKNISIENIYNEDFASGTYSGKQLATGNHQAVALEVDGADKAQFEKVLLSSNQDTLYVKSGAVGTTIRAYFRNCYIEGDVDFIFGRATAYFKKCEIKYLGARNTPTGFCLAPSTNYMTTYGFVFEDCDFTSDGLGLAKTQGVYLGRQWFESSQLSPYGNFEGSKAVVLGTAWNASGTNNAANMPMFVYEAVGKAIIMNSRIGSHINQNSPWADWDNTEGGNSKYYRLAQYNSDVFWKYLTEALAKSTANKGLKPTDIYPSGKKNPVEPFLAEFNNTTK